MKACGCGRRRWLGCTARANRRTARSHLWMQPVPRRTTWSLARERQTGSSRRVRTARFMLSWAASSRGIDARLLLARSDEVCSEFIPGLHLGIDVRSAAGVKRVGDGNAARGDDKLARRGALNEIR